ncbi:MAG: hypothetical protein ACPGN3_06230 [Opitutales bacterium]
MGLVNISDICFDVTGGWTDHFTVTLFADHTGDNPVTGLDDAILNGTCLINQQKIGILFKKKNSGSYSAKVTHDLTRDFVESLKIYLASNERHEPIEIKPLNEGNHHLIFTHSEEKAHQTIRRRKGLKNGKRQQLMAALQSYLWARKTNNVPAQATAICSRAYRFCDIPNKVRINDIRRLAEDSTHFLNSVEMGPKEIARWYPSVLISCGQAFLITGSQKKAIKYLMEASNRFDKIHEAPISAYNVSLANCLLSYFFWKTGDKRFKKIARRWETIFQDCVKHMNIRFGTIYEFGRIYEALFLNYRMLLCHEKHEDRRLKEPECEEVLRACIRSKFSPSIWESLKNHYDIF